MMEMGASDEAMQKLTEAGESVRKLVKHWRPLAVKVGNIHPNKVSETLVKEAQQLMTTGD